MQYTSKEEYLEEIRNQIRCRKAKNHVTDEIEQHIEELREAFIAEGEEDYAATVKALEQMGNPMEIGKQLDLVHRPRLEWRLLLLVLALSSLGLLIQLSIDGAYKSSILQNYGDIKRQFLFVITGCLLMVLVYFVDFSMIGRYAKSIWIILLAGCIVSNLYGSEVNGRVPYLAFITMLFLPLYGGIIYSYRRSGYMGIIKCLLFCLLTTVMVVKMVAQSNVYVGFLLSCLLMLTTAIFKDWFGTRKKRSLLIIYGWPFILLMLNFLTGNRVFSAYQWERLQKWIDIIRDPENNELGYLMNLVRQTIIHSKLFGKSSDYSFGYSMNMNSDYILTYVIDRFGIVAGVLLVALFAVLLIRLFQVVRKQKNSLGMFIGLGCSLVFLTLSVNYILTNLGLQILSQVNLPFVSYGGASMLVNFTVMGIMLSVFRNSSISKEIPYTRYRFRIEKLR